MSPISRPAVRIVCLDEHDRVLLLHWRDPVSGRTLWEPPGGGIEAGESPARAAVRELWEETGMVVAEPTAPPLPVPRRFRWAGRDFETVEDFFLIRIATFAPLPAAPTDSERETYLGHRWASPTELDLLDGELEPPELSGVIERFPDRQR